MKKLENALRDNGIYQTIDKIRSSAPGVAWWTYEKEELIYGLVTKVVAATLECVREEMARLSHMQSTMLMVSEGDLPNNRKEEMANAEDKRKEEG